MPHFLVASEVDKEMRHVPISSYQIATRCSGARYILSAGLTPKAV